MEVKSYFTTKTPISNINYVLPKKHATYIVGSCNDTFTYARRNVYGQRIDEWLNQPFLSDYQRNNPETLKRRCFWYQ